MFQHIRIEASPEHVEIAEAISLSCIRPYVKAITMTPSKYSWTTTEDTFQQTVSTPRIEEICQQMERRWYQARSAGEDISNIPSSGDAEIKDLGWKAFVQKHSNSMTLFPEREMIAAYGRYAEQAERLRDMFETKRIH